MTSADRFWAKAFKSIDECWYWTGSVKGKGYGQFWYEGRSTRAHRVAWLLTHGKIPKGKHVLHTCDNRQCVNPAHLYLGTNKDNCRDKALRGWHGSQKLTDDQVREVRQTKRYARGLAQKLGVSSKTISVIRNGKSRSRVPPTTRLRLRQVGAH